MSQAYALSESYITGIYRKPLLKANNLEFELVDTTYLTYSPEYDFSSIIRSLLIDGKNYRHRPNISLDLFAIPASWRPVVYNHPVNLTNSVHPCRNPDKT